MRQQILRLCAEFRFWPKRAVNLGLLRLILLNIAAKSCTDLIDLAKFNPDEPSGKFGIIALNFAERDGKFRANLRASHRILLSLKKAG